MLPHWVGQVLVLVRRGFISTGEVELACLAGWAVVLRTAAYLQLRWSKKLQFS